MDPLSMDTRDIPEEQNDNKDQNHEVDIKILSENIKVSNTENIEDSENVEMLPKQMILIQLVSQEPAIFNSKHSDYRNLAKKDELWLAMSKQIGWTDIYCKNKWKAIRDQYCRELKRARKNPNANIKWKYFKHLEFLRPYALARNYRPKMTRSHAKTDISEQLESSNTQSTIQSNTSNSKESDLLPFMKNEDWTICENDLNDNGDITSQIIMQLTQEDENGFPKEDQPTQEPQDDEDDDPIHTFLNIESYFEKELITMIQKEPILYDCRHLSYRNTKSKLIVWEDIARKLKKSVRQCRLKWKALRDQYIREHKRLKNFDVCDNAPRWKHYDAMNFLEKFLKGKPESYIMSYDTAELELPENDFEHEEIITTILNNEEHMEQFILGNGETSSIYTESLLSSNNANDQSQPASNEEVKIEDMVIEEISQEKIEPVRSPSNNGDCDDEVGAFFRAVAIKIRKANMSSVAFTELQIDILKVITNALKD